MKTEILTIDPIYPQPELIRRAAQLLRSGQLVAFPTETVYGLGSNALDANAVRSIYEAKGRPPTNPIIVHVADKEAAKLLAVNWSDTAERLADEFWPGPLTLVVRKSPAVPDIVTAGAATVAVRVPSHAIALALITAADIPVAAPSANRSNRLSPTQAKHVYQDLQGKIPLILDGGPTSGGLESTVIDVTCEPPRVLRPGLVTVHQLRHVVGNVDTAESFRDKNSGVAPSPGMLKRHYAPRTPLECWATGISDRAARLVNTEDKICLLYLNYAPPSSFDGIAIPMPTDVKEYSACLYATLHDLDQQDLHRILIELPPNTDEWRAVRDRLRRASEVFRDR